MYEYKITYNFNSQARVFTCSAESDGEALEQFDDFSERFDDGLEVLSVVEVAK